MAENDNIDKEVFIAVQNTTKKAIQKIATQEYIEEIRDRIVQRTKLGTGVDPDTGASQRLKKLSTNYKKSRNKNKSRLDNTTTPGKSNLTATGQLLRSLKVETKRLTDGIKFTIRVGNKRTRNLDGSRSKVGNRDLVKYLAAQGREFLGLTKSQRNEIAKEIRQFIKKFL